ncbi:MAG: HYR domain-containing protein [Saprospiraceae bacterium]|nr:HYR domain-containing protein [Saprospiraceae bacterium]
MGTLGDCAGQFEWNHPIPSSTCGVVSYLVSYQNPDGTYDGPYDLYQVYSGGMFSYASRDFEVGESLVRYSVEDGSGGVAKCEFKVVVVDDEAPYFYACPGDVTVSNDPGKCGAYVSWVVPHAGDNCGVERINRVQGPAPGSFLLIGGSYTIRYNAIDYEGYVTPCEWKVTVADRERPDIECPMGPVYLPTNEGCAHRVRGSDLNATATDNCQGTVRLEHSYGVHYLEDNLYDAVFDLGITKVTWVASDYAGNTSSCTVTLVVVDKEDPSVQSCPPSVTLPSDAGDCGAVHAYEALFSDNCDGTGLAGALIEGLPSGSLFPVGTTTVVWRYVDAAGNDFAECLFAVTVEDVEYPTIACPTPIVVGIDGSVSGGLGGSPLASPALVASGPCGVTLRYEAPVGEDNCPNALTVLQSGLGGGPSHYAYGGIYTETYNVYDASGNVATCSFTILVEDPVEPTITCSESVTVPTDLGACHATVNYSYPYHGDNCPGYSLTQLAGPNSGSAFPVGGPVTVRFRVTDDAGNSAECEFAVTVEDRERPFIGQCPPPVVSATSSDGSGDCLGAVPDMTGALLATDNCGVTGVTQSPLAGASFGGSHGSKQSVTFVVTDAAGNTSSCQSKVTLADDEPPSVDCSGLTATLYATPGFCGHKVVPGDAVNPSFADNCGGAKRRHDFLMAPHLFTLEGGVLPVGLTTVWWAVTDAAGNTTGCAATYEVLDTVPPVFLNCPESDVTLSSDPGKCGASVWWLSPVATDDCGATVTRAGGPAPGSYLEVDEPYLIVYEATDASGNVSTCSWTITIRDRERPDIECPLGLQVVGTNDGCSHRVFGDYLDATATDNCQATVRLGHSYGTHYLDNTLYDAVFDLGITKVTWTATDHHGNTATCVVKIVVVDDVPPTVRLCPDVIEADSDPGVCGAEVHYTVRFRDNCDSDERASEEMYLNQGLESGSVFPVGTTVVVWRYYDAAGNGFAECLFEVRVSDVEDPTIACPTDIVVGIDGSLSGGVGGVPPASPALVASGPCGVTLRYTPPAGADNCPNPLTVLTSGLGHGPNYYGYGGVYTEAYKVTDASGNTAACSFTVTVLDPVEPTITCPSNTTVDNNAGLCGAYVTYSFPYFGDNCPGYSLTLLEGPNSGDLFDVGVTTVAFEVSDDAGNAVACSFTVTVLDVEKPVIATCPADRAVPTSSNGEGDCTGLVPDLVPEVVAADNCGIAGIAQSPAAGTSFGAAHGDKIFVTIVVTDIYGNVETCKVKLTLVDDENPTIDCSAIPTQLDNTPQYCHYFVAGLELSPAHDDNCGPVVLTNSLTGNHTLGGTPLPVGSTTVDWKATDAAGNMASCSVTYVVTDSEPPVAMCQGAQIDVVLDGDGLAQLTVAGVNNDSWDNCGPLSRKEISRGGAFGQFVYFSCADIFALNGLLDVILEVEDQHGNIARCTTQVAVLDLTPPVITCPNGVETVTDPGVCTAIVNGIGLQYAYDNCPVTIAYEISGATTKSGTGDASGTVFNKGVSVVTYTVVDESGNSAVCSFDVEVYDEEAPIVDCSNIANLVRPNNPDQCSYTVVGIEFDPASFSDNCPGATIKNSHNSSPSLAGAEFPVGTTTVIWTVTDASGNTATCSSKVKIEDAQLPTITCPTAGATAFVNDPGQCSRTILSGILDPAFADNCPGARISHGYVTAPNPWTLAGATFPVGNTEVSWTVTDKAGNTASCSIVVSVTDAEAPKFANCPVSMVMVGNDVDKCSAKLNWSIPVATDNCGISSVAQTGGPANGSDVPVSPSPLTVTYTATDVHGNTAACSFQVLVVDTQKPEFDADITMPADITVECDAIPTSCVFKGNGPGLICAPLDNGDVSDNCTAPGDLVIGFTETSTKCADPAQCCFYSYSITRTWTVTDAAGNARVHTQVITVVDTTPPVAKCKNVTATLDKFGVATVTGAGINDGSTDNCAAPQHLTYQAVPGTLGCNDLGPNDVTLVVTDPCGNSGTCTAVVTVVEGIGKCVPEYDLARSVKCECLNNATTLDNGQFREVVQIWALAGQTWTLTANQGLYSPNSPAPPASPVPLPVGTVLVMGSADGLDNNGNGAVDEADEMVYYTLRGVHVDGVGYTITVKNAQGQSLTISSKCYYPTPVFLNLDDPFCLSTPPFQIQVGENYGASGTVTSITVNGVATGTFNAASLGIGSHKVAATFDAGTATPFIRVNGQAVSGSESAALADPGCQQMIMKFVQVVGTPASVVCNDLLHVSLGPDCVKALSPDDVLEGSYFCYDDYKVELDKVPPYGNGPWVPAVLNADDIGKTYAYRVVHLLGGNVCWGSVKVEDKLPPAVACPADVSILCTQDEDNLSLTGVPTWQDCSAASASRQDDYVQYSCSENPAVLTRVLRTWVVTDAWGNSSTCLQVIDKLRGKVSQVTFPADAEYACDALPSSLAPAVTGWPRVGGTPITTDGSGACGLSVSYTDEQAAVCPGSYKIIRTWKITDWCTGGAPESVTHVQYVKVLDAPPTIDFSNFAYDAAHGWYVIPAASQHNGQCVASGPLPLAVIDGVCNAVTQVKITTPVGVVQNGGLIPAPGLGVGQHKIKYFVEDQCGNITERTITVSVEDVAPPSVACTQFTQVALGASGKSLVNASTFDQGTWDNCCLDRFEVRRMSGACDGSPDDFGPTVEFCCSDVGDTVTVVFRAWDCNKNHNDCMVRVLVEDKIKPVCDAPASVTVSCESFDPSLWAYGFATGADNCCLDTVTEARNLSLFDTLCNRGTITRTFRALDCAGNSAQCTQRVTVTYEQDYWVRFPNDVIVTQCDGTGNYGAPTFAGAQDCELLGVSFEDQVFTVVPDACFKIERTWTIINWCTYNPNGGCVTVPNPEPNATANSPQNLTGPTVSPCGTPAPWAPTSVAIAPGQAPTNFCTFWSATANCYRYKQIIKIIDNQKPVFASCPASPVEYCDLSANDPLLWNQSYWWDGVSHDLCEGDAPLSVTATDSCSGSNVSVTFLLFLDLDGDGTMETVVSSNNPPAPGTVSYNNLNTPNYAGGTPRVFDGRPVPAAQTYRWAVHQSVSGTSRTASVQWKTQAQLPTPANPLGLPGVAPQLPHGTHKIKWTVSDGCGNEETCEYTFVVRDCKAPTVVCLHGLSANIMPTGMLTLWASDFLQYGEDNCAPSSLLRYGVRKAGQGTGFPVDAQGNPVTSVTFTCAELGEQAVELWAQDLAGNADFCLTYLDVQDNAGNCVPGDKATVAGWLKTESGAGLEDASVQLVSGASSQASSSDAQGAYAFPKAVPLGGSYTVTPTKDDNPLNGVSTYDLVLISRHILGLEPLSSPYRMIAADANKSGSITTFDIVELRKLILGLYDELPNNTSWRFVDKSFAFPNPDNPFQTQFPETVSAADVQGHHLSDDFVAVKVGDVNGTAIPSSLHAGDDRSSGALLFDVDDRELRAGELATVTFRAAERAQGWQFTLGLSGLEVASIEEGERVRASNFGVFAGALTTSVDLREPEAGEFSVTFRAARAGRLSEMLGVSSRITRAEAYSPSGDRMGVALRFHGAGGPTVAGVGFELYQNQPNPFVNKTVIGFHLPEATDATLTVFDESGRLLFTQKGSFAKGHNAIAVDRALLGPGGLMYYRLETATDSETRKMIQAR